MKAKVLNYNSHLYKVLGHSKRLEIVTLLQGHSLTVNQIVQMTALRQAAASQHLGMLKEAGLVVTQKIGKEIYYSLSQISFLELASFTKLLSRTAPVENSEPTVIDPICHMHLTPTVASYTTEYDGVRHYFCGKGCLNEFKHTHKGAK